MMKIFGRAGLPLMQPYRYNFSVLGGSSHSKDAEVLHYTFRTLSSKNIQ